MIVISEDQFVLDRAGAMPHATFTRATANMSQAALRRAQKQHAANLRAWAERVASARNEYRAGIASSELRPPTRHEHLQARALGNPDRADVQAARRLLQKEDL